MMVLDDLCRVAELVTLPNGKTFRIRALSDYERRQADMKALAMSARFAESLKDPTSEEYQAYILPVRQAGVEQMREAVVSWKRAEITREVYAEIPPVYIPFPDKASETERREVLLKRKEKSEEVRVARDKMIEDRTKAYADQISSDGEETLLAKFDRLAIEGRASTLYGEEFYRMIIFYASEVEDGSRRYFSSIDDVRNLPPNIRNYLYEKYIEVDSTDPFLLNAPSATESSTEQ